MEKVLSKILISVFMVSIFLAPVGLIVKERNIGITINQTNAQSTPGYIPPPTNGNSQTPAKPSFDFQCAPLSGEIVGCIAWILYYAVWSPLAIVASLAGYFLDFFIFFSTNSSAYDKGFINLAWSAVRDIANLFFIISLLYVAIQTILGLGHHGKNMIKNIIIIALIINFSLFFTKVVIDATNILTKVFYNNITVKNEVPVFGKPKSLSVGLVSIFDPQEIMGDNSTFTQEEKEKRSPAGLFIFIILLSSVIMGFMVYIFVSCGLLFVARVAGLWLAMILSPIAFASTMLPFDIPGLGFNKWKDDLLKQAFLGPVFVFFLYIIFLFGDLFKIITSDYASTDSFTQKLMTTIVPFALVFVLLQKAKGLAVQFSGEIGAAVNKAGATIGGFALGAVTGGAALLGSSTIGKFAASKVGNADWQEKAGQRGMTGFMYRTALKSANYGSKATFDVRKSPLGDLAAKGGLNLDKGTGVLGLGGKNTAGGYKGQVERRQVEIEKEQELFKTKMDNGKVKEWSDKRKADYEARLAEARAKGGEAEEEFIKKNGGAPKEFSTAAALNAERMRVFRENIGKTGILYSASHSIAKANNENKTPEELDALAKKIKLAIGGSAAILSGGLGGTVLGGVVGHGAIGALAGSVVGGTAAYTQNVFDTGAEEAAIKNLKKENDKAEKVEKELETLKERKDTIEKLVEGIKAEPRAKTKDASGADVDVSYDEHISGKLLAAEFEMEKAKKDENVEAYQKAGLDKIKYQKAQKADEDLRSINTRMETVEGKKSHYKPKSKDKPISTPSASTTHAPADDHKADAHAGGDAHHA